MKKNLKRLFLLLGSLLAVVSLSGCFLMKGSRANIEKQFEVLGEIYPTQNVNDLKEKFPEGVRLSNRQVIGDMVYAVVVEGSPSQSFTGTFRVGKYHKDALAEVTVFKIEITIDEENNLVSKGPIPTEYQEQFHNFPFLFEGLNLSKEKVSKFNYFTHSSNANNGYFISYYIDNPEVAKVLNATSGHELRLTMEGNFDADREHYAKGIELQSGNNSIDEYISSKGQIKGE